VPSLLHGLVLAATLLALAGCAAPAGGRRRSRSGAGARLLWRCASATPPSAGRPPRRRPSRRVRRAAAGRPEDTGRLGDRARQRPVGVVVANVDGRRAPASWSTSRDGRGRRRARGLETRVLGSRAVRDAEDRLDASSAQPTSRSPVGDHARRRARHRRHPLRPRPGLDTVLVSTRVKFERVGPADDAEPATEEAVPLIQDRIAVAGARSPRRRARPILAASGRAPARAQPAADGGFGARRWSPAAKTPPVGVDFLYSRTLTALERPDSRGRGRVRPHAGEPLGELEEARPRERARRGSPVSAGDRRLVARALPACGTPRAYRVRVPAARTGQLQNGAVASRPRAPTSRASASRSSRSPRALRPSRTWRRRSIDDARQATTSRCQDRDNGPSLLELTL
jgi:hypothetical protein